MYFAATVFDPDGHGDNTKRRLGVARADHPLGPFIADPEPLIPDEYAIDADPFQDEDGSLWLFYNVRRDELSFNGLPSSANVVDRLVTPTELAGEVTPVAVPSEPWEGSLDGTHYWNEGCWVLKRRGRYHQLYSGSHYRDGRYAIGLSGADAVRGEWTKYPRNPIFATGERIIGGPVAAAARTRQPGPARPAGLDRRPPQRQASGLHQPDFDTDGEIVAGSLTSHFDDEAALAGTRRAHDVAVVRTRSSVQAGPTGAHITDLAVTAR